MRIPDRWIEADEVESTQAAAAGLVSSGETSFILFAHHQSRGKGRFGREWHSVRGESLTMSLALGAYSDHPKPWLVGMAIAAAVADALDCRLRWPNDLDLGGKKLGGILTELLASPDGGRVPVVGIGINLAQTGFPIELDGRATSLSLEGRTPPLPSNLARDVLAAIARAGEPESWADIASFWGPRDATPGKTYLLPDGTIGEAEAIGDDGQLLCRVQGRERAVYAADALFGEAERMGGGRAATPQT